MNRIYIYCAGNLISGGIISLHNLCGKLVENGFDAGMFYFSAQKEIVSDEQILSFNVSVFNTIDDIHENLLVVSETETLFLHNFKNIKKAIYWLSLNHFFIVPPFRFPFNIDILRNIIYCRNYSGYSSGIREKIRRYLNWWNKKKDIAWQENIIHISNSFYVLKFFERKGIGKIHILHNPVIDEFYDESKNISLKKDKIIFGPKTPGRLVRLLKVFLPYEVIILEHMKLKCVKQHMKEAKVFAEFGNFPGRDRMPREAALLGCMVISNTRGSAAVCKDMPIPARYKISDSWFNYFKIVKTLRSCIDNYESGIHDFDEYIQKLNEEKLKFSEKVKSLFHEIMSVT